MGCEYSLYYELACRGEVDEPTYNPLYRTTKYSSYSNPLLSVEAIKNLEKEFPPHLRKQELGGEFIDMDGTGIFNSKWFQIVDTLPPASEWRDLVLSADTAFETKESNDDTAICLMLNATNGYYILDLLAAKLEILELLNTLNEMYIKHNFRWSKKIKYMLVEKKASGHSVIQALNKKTKINIKDIVPKEDKFTRASATTPIFETGHVFLLRGGWNQRLIDQMTEFNALMDTPDDIVDCVTQAINFFESKPMLNYTKVF
jgi:predicted phage terminase large subunit-like protein